MTGRKDSTAITVPHSTGEGIPITANARAPRAQPAIHAADDNPIEPLEHLVLEIVGIRQKLRCSFETTVSVAEEIEEAQPGNDCGE